MWGLSIREGIKILIVTLLATILAVIIQLVVVSGADTLFSVISSPQNLVDSLYQAFSLPISSFSLFVILVTMFAFSTSFLNSIYSVLAGGVELRPSVKAEKPKKEKKKKEKKEKKKKEEAKVEAKPPEEPVIDTGNYCKICGKPISLGRAICKECEAMLRGEAPPTQQQAEAGA